MFHGVQPIQLGGKHGAAIKDIDVVIRFKSFPAQELTRQLKVRMNLTDDMP